MTALDEVLALEMACVASLRRPSTWVDDGAGGRTAIFDPPLTAEEQATFASLAAFVHSQIALSPADWALIETRLPALRTFRQQTRAEFMALSATERDRATFDALQDIIAVLVAMLRD